MAKVALYQKYRSSTFEEVVGQEYIVQSIKNAVRENKVGHAYLFCGPRGTGKTTMARLLAKAVNCENPENAPCEKCSNCIAANNGTHPDIIEINAANETHVEDIRDLIDRSRLAPMQGKHKVYIIDEVHQLSSAASSALLKTLEEPPKNVIFILATTDPQKLLPTIISRCQRFDFTKVKTNQIRDHLLDIAEKENIKMEKDAAMMIAVLSDGGMRDALSIMDQCASYTSDEITVDAIDRIYGLTTISEKISLMKDIFHKNLESILNRISQYENKGIDFVRYTDGMIDILKDVAIYSSTKNDMLLKKLNKEEAEDLSQELNASYCMQMCEKLIDVKERYRLSSSVARVFEVTCLSMAIEPQPIVSRETMPTNSSIQTVQNVKAESHETAPFIKLEETSKPVIKNTEPLPKKNIEKLSQEKILQILVACDKQNKVTDENTFMMLDSYATLENRKYTSVLQECKIAASGADCILLKSDMQSIVNRVNEEKMNRDLYQFLKDILHTDKMVYAISNDDFNEATKAFREAMINKTLPKPLEIKKYTEETQKEPDSVQKVKEIFGAENVEIV